MKFTVKGDLVFRDKLCELASSNKRAEIVYEESEKNQIVFYADSDIKYIFENIDIFGLNCELYISTSEGCMSVFDVEKLQKLQNDLIIKKDWKAVKVINRLFIEYDSYKKNIEVSYYPTNLQIEHTNICNSKCIMCEHFFTRNHNGKFVDESFIEKLKPILPYLEKITLHGMGEPFLHPNISEFIKLYDAYGIKMTAATNGMIMSEELASLIGKAFYSLTVSCDGCTQNTFEGIRKGLSFEKFLSNIKLLRKKCPTLEMKMSTVAMRQNLHELPGIVKLAYELGFDMIIISDVTTQEIMKNTGDSITFFPKTAQYYLKQAKSVAEKLDIDIQCPDYIFKIKGKLSFEEEQEIIKELQVFPDDSLEEELYKKYAEIGFLDPKIQATMSNFVVPSKYNCEGICNFVLERPFLDINGNLFLCCTNWMHITGNVFKDGSFMSVWNGEIYKGIRKLFYDGKVPQYCVGCICLRTDILVNRINISNMDAEFYKHNYDKAVSKLIEDGIK